MEDSIPYGINKQSIACSFGRAAASYDAHASLQREVADALAQRLRADGAALRVLDLGSGTGYCSALLRRLYPGAEIVNLDLSDAMLDYARTKNSREPGGKSHYVCADAEGLPFKANSFDVIFSSLTIQWCRDYEQLFSEIKRVARRGAQCCFSTFGPSTLRELRSAWEAVDSHVHVNEFAAAGTLERVIRGCGFSGWKLEQEAVTRYYPGLRELGGELKAIGAHNMNRGQARGLTGKRRLSRLKDIFKQGEVPGRGVPVTYELITMELMV